MRPSDRFTDGETVEGPAPPGQHVRRHQDDLWEELLKLAATVETALQKSVLALCDGSPELALQVKQGEREIDRWEVRIERECLRVLALFSPVASDLRRVAAVLKINADLERMADLAEHIATRARKLAKGPVPVPIPPKMEALVTEALAQVRRSLDALAQHDAEQARAVIAADRQIDRLRRELLKELKQAVQREPERVTTWLRLMNTARNLERVADHAANIAKSVIYMEGGEIVRHGERELRAR